MPATLRITRILFHNFKAFEEFSISIQDVNLLVGPNNSGKSTIIGALRALDSAVRLARTRAPKKIFIGETGYIGYWIPADSLPISL